jgi:glycosyltransferase involved in cell wall biosynthesis
MTPVTDEQPARVSAVVLTLNEEGNIERCLASLSWADEVVVVDSGSTDRTVPLAAAAGAKVIEHRQQGPFRISEQRNWALEEAGLTGDWILFLDADEEVTDELAAEIQQRCAASGKPDAYQLAPKYLFRGRWMRRCMRFPAWHDRLLRRGRVTFAGGVWEHFTPVTNCGQIHQPYNHYGNSQGMSAWLERHDRYSTWEARSVVDYLESGNDDAFRTSLRLGQRKKAARLWPLRPVVRFLVMYIMRGGFLDGPEAFPFCLRYAMYEFIIIEKIVDERRRRRHLPL